MKNFEEKAIKSCTCNLCYFCEEPCEEDDEKCEEFNGMVNGYILAYKELKTEEEA